MFIREPLPACQHQGLKDRSKWVPNNGLLNSLMEYTEEINNGATCVPRPPNAFLLFRAQAVAPKVPPMNRRQRRISYCAGAIWNLLEQDVRDEWHIIAAEFKAWHKTKYPETMYRSFRGKGEKEDEDLDAQVYEEMVAKAEEECEMERPTPACRSSERHVEYSYPPTSSHEEANSRIREVKAEKSESPSLSPGLYSSSTSPASTDYSSPMTPPMEYSRVLTPDNSLSHAQEMNYASTELGPSNQDMNTYSVWGSGNYEPHPTQSLESYLAAELGLPEEEIYDIFRGLMDMRSLETYEQYEYPQENTSPATFHSYE